jgi:hypothetical protein
MSDSVQRVWLILVKIKVVDENPVNLRIGSEAVVQCFVPVNALETALTACDELLQREGLERLDVFKCLSFEEIDEEDDVPAFIERYVLRARTSGEALTGTFFTNEGPSSSVH